MEAGDTLVHSQESDLAKTALRVRRGWQPDEFSFLREGRTVSSVVQHETPFPMSQGVRLQVLHLCPRSLSRPLLALLSSLPRVALRGSFAAALSTGLSTQLQ